MKPVEKFSEFCDLKAAANDEDGIRRGTIGELRHYIQTGTPLQVLLIMLHLSYLSTQNVIKAMRLLFYMYFQKEKNDTAKAIT